MRGKRKDAMSIVDQAPRPDQPMLYQVKVWGRITEHLVDWSEGMTVAFEDNITTINAVVDQSSLRGIVTRLWDLNVTLISINRISTITEE